jgi:hypothetical protein
MFVFPVFVPRFVILPVEVFPIPVLPVFVAVFIGVEAGVV